MKPYQKYVLIFFLIFNCKLTAQNNRLLKFTHLTINQGLSTNTVTCILQDSKGFMWIGTPDGLNRYNGYEFEIYHHEPTQKHTLPANHINDLFEDSQQVLWIATHQGICKYNRQTNQFVRINEIIANDITDDVASAFLEDKEKRLWAASGKYLYYLDRKKNKFIPCPTFTQANISSFLQLDSNSFLITTLGAGFFIYDIRTQKVRQYLHQIDRENSVCNNDVWAAYKDIDGAIWVGTEGGLDKFNLQKQIFEHFKQSKDSTQSLLVESVRQIIGEGNEIWFATENGGLSKYDLKNKRFTHHLVDKSNSKSINDVSIWALYKDRQNRLWVGTFSGGLNIADPYEEKFSSPAIILKNKVVNAMLLDSKNRLWIGTEGGLVLQEGKNTYYYTQQAQAPYSLPNNPVLSILEDNKQRIWLGVWAGGLCIFDETNRQFINFKAGSGNPHRLSNPNIFWVGQSSQTKQILATSWDGGFHILQNEAQQDFLNFSKNSYDNSSISDNLCKIVYEDSKKNIWIGTTNGLNRFDINTRKFTRYFHNKNKKNSISNNYINSIWEDSKGRLWIGTSNGLNQMIDSQSFIKYTSLDGLPNNSINGILDDKKGNLWLSTNKGIARFNPETKKIRNFDEADGLQSKQFKGGSYFKAKDGRLFFGGVNGFNAFYSDSIKENPNVPNIFLQDFKIFNQSVRIGEYDSLLQQHISQTKEITLSYKYSVFSFEFVALNFTHPEKNQYAYIMENFEKKWNYVGNQRNATYTNLDAGTYIFRVKASNNDGVWNEEGIKLIIHILPPWWKTLWFRFLLVLIFVISGPIFYFYRLNAIKKQNQKLEQIVELRTQELNTAYQTLQNNQEELLYKNEEITRQNDELNQQQEEIATLNNHLEVLVEERTHKLIQSNKKLNDYAFFNAHKLRAPIATILGLYELIKVEPCLVDKEVAFAKIKESIILLDELVRISQGLLDEVDNEIVIDE